MKPYKKMTAQQKRVVQEHHELTERAERLDLFMGSEFWEELPQEERRRLDRQLTYMKLYIDVLQERIDAF